MDLAHTANRLGTVSTHKRDGSEAAADHVQSFLGLVAGCRAASRNAFKAQTRRVAMVVGASGQFLTSQWGLRARAAGLHRTQETSVTWHLHPSIRTSADKAKNN